MTTEKNDRNEKEASSGGVPDDPRATVVVNDVSMEAHSAGSRFVPLLDPDNERRLMIFTDFWHIAVRYQIVNDLTDHYLSTVILGLSDKTVGNWRRCIISSGSVNDLIVFIDHLSVGKTSENRVVVRAALARRLDELTKMPKSTEDKWGALPSVQTFKYAVEYSVETVLANLVMDLGAPSIELGGGQILIGASGRLNPSVKEKALAEDLAIELIGLFQRSTLTKLEIYRDELERRLVKVGEICSRLSLHRGLAARFFGDENPGLVEALAVAVHEAKHEAKSYLDKLYLRVLSGDQLSERTSFLGRLQSGQDLYYSGPIADRADPLHLEWIENAKEIELDQLYRLIEFHAEIRAIEPPRPTGMAEKAP